jgi:thioredoxin-dependent peroxiredoxin
MTRFAQHNAELPLAAHERRRLRATLLIATAVLAVLIVVGLIVERQARTPLIQVGQPAPDWTLPSASGEMESLAAQRGHSVVLVFVPSVNCPICRAQLRTLQAALPELRARGTAAFAISTDLPAVQRSYSAMLGLEYPLLSEAPAFGLHPVGSAYGVYHGAGSQAGPVDISAVVVIDAAGVVRAVSVLPNQFIDANQLIDFVAAAGRTQ